MSEIKDYFDAITTSKSAADIAKTAMLQAEKRREKSRIKFRPVAIAAAAIVAMGGVTAAAVGLLNINDIFGGRISAQEEMLASELVIPVQDFTWSVSDDDYMIELKGVTGSKSDMLLAYEIKRTDGKPVTDYMTNIPENGQLSCISRDVLHEENTTDSDYIPPNCGITSMTSATQCSINDMGNIEIYYKTTSDGDIRELVFTSDNLNLYPADALEEFEKQNDMFGYYRPSSTITAGFYPNTDGSIYDKQPLDISVNDERIIGLELEWSVEFTYSPNDTAIKVKKINANDLYLECSLMHYIDGSTTKKFTLADSEFSCVSGKLTLTRTSYLENSISDEYNDIYLISDNGDNIPCSIITYSDSFDQIDLTEERYVEVQYSSAIEGAISAVNIEKINAISINGEIFPLE